MATIIGYLDHRVVVQLSIAQARYPSWQPHKPQHTVLSLLSFNRSGAIPLMATPQRRAQTLQQRSFNRSGAIPLMATHDTCGHKVPKSTFLNSSDLPLTSTPSSLNK